MKKLVLFLGLFLSLAAFAGNKEVGLKVYKSRLKPYFGKLAEFLEEEDKEFYEWRRYLNKEEVFILEYSDKYPESRGYLTSEHFHKNYEDVLTLFIESMKSGDLPSCN